VPIDAPVVPRDIAIDRAPPESPLLADLPPIPAGPPPGARVTRRGGSDGWASAWTDRAAIRRLAADCDFHPDARDGAGDGDPLHCATDISQQSCVSDPCFEQVDTPCRNACGDRCETCDATCRVACSQCRAACGGPACVLTCATRCGACLQTCIDAKDHCLTAGCAARYRACRERLFARYRDGRCSADCGRCRTECSDGDHGSGCFDACLNRANSCSREERDLCEGVGVDPGFEFLLGPGYRQVLGLPP